MFSRQVGQWIACGLIFLCCVKLATAQDDEPEPTDAPSDKIKNDEPGFFVRVDVNRADRMYRQSDPLSIDVVAEQDAYLYVMYQQADGKTFQIYPNSVQSANRAKGKTVVSIPAKDDQFRWKIGPPYGKEVIKVVASKEPVADLNDPSLRKQRFNPVTQSQIASTARTLQDEAPAKWAEDAIEITTSPRDAAPAEPQGRRFGVFFGTSIYKFNAEAKEAAEGKWEPNLSCPANNARVLAHMMKEMGGLDEARVFVDADSTKRNLELAVTKYLPQISKPGDTVFIFIGGHGGQLPDDNGDEADGKDEWLLIGDYVDLGILNVLMQKQKEGKLDAETNTLVNELVAFVRPMIRPNDNNSLARANTALCRRTGVSDDLFGHWMQRLSGRKIVVLLDTCHSSGLAQGEKGFQTKDIKSQGEEFDFVDGEIGRLKDLGQRDSAVLAACGAQQSSYALRASDAYIEKMREDATKTLVDERVGVGLAVFSYHLVETLISQPGPLDLNQVHIHTRDGMRNYFKTINPIFEKKGDKPLVPHESHLYNYSTKPILFKP